MSVPCDAPPRQTLAGKGNEPAHMEHCERFCERQWLSTCRLGATIAPGAAAAAVAADHRQAAPVAAWRGSELLAQPLQLGDRERWPEIRDDLLRWMDSGDNETSLIPQWEASLRFDQREALPNVRVPMHVLAFNEDIQAPPQDGEELAELVPGAELHLFQGMGHGSWYGLTHDVLNPFIEELITRHL